MNAIFFEDKENFRKYNIPLPTEYRKGEIKTSELIPTDRNQVLGSGLFGKVIVHKTNPHLVVKKSGCSLRTEYALGKMMDHPNLVKSIELFEKIEQDGSIYYKLVMNRIQGKPISEYFPIDQKLPHQKIKTLLIQAFSVCLYVFKKNIFWADLSPQNVYVDENGLLIGDFGFWRLFEKLEGGILNDFIDEFHSLVINILNSGDFKEDDVSKIKAHIKALRAEFSKIRHVENQEVRLSMLQNCFDGILQSFQDV